MYQFYNQLCMVPQTSSDYVSYNRTPVNEAFAQFSTILSILNLEVDITKTFMNTGYFMVIDVPEQLQIVFPARSVIENYSPKSRPWYVQHLQNLKKFPGQSFFYTNLYQYYLYRSAVLNQVLYGITQTQSLQNGTEFQGVVGTDIDFKKILQLTANLLGLNLMLVYDDGTILFQNTYINIDFTGNQTVIQNTSLTGFNQTDWEQLQFIAQSTQSAQFHNKLFNIKPLLTISRDYGTPFYFIVYGNQTYQEAQLMQIKLRYQT